MWRKFVYKLSQGVEEREQWTLSTLEAQGLTWKFSEEREQWNSSTVLAQVHISLGLFLSQMNIQELINRGETSLLFTPKGQVWLHEVNED